MAKDLGKELGLTSKDHRQVIHKELQRLNKDHGRELGFKEALKELREKFNK